jgi:hypothetical protein
MAIYCIIASTEAAKLKAAIAEHYSDVYELPPNVWLVVDPGTTTQVRDKLGLNGKGLGLQGVQGIVVNSNGISGYAPSDIWEWVRVKMEDRPDG